MEKLYLSNSRLESLAKEKKVILIINGFKKEIKGKIIFNDLSKGYNFIYREDKNTIADFDIDKKKIKYVKENTIFSKTDCLFIFFHYPKSMGNYEEYNKILKE